MITHKIRIYPNKHIRELFEEQFEFARRDYNRQLEMLVRGVSSGAITVYNVEDSLQRIRRYCARHFDFYHPHLYHFPDIIGWNAKRISTVAKLFVSRCAKAKYKKYGVGKKAFKICSSDFDDHRARIEPGKRLVIGGIGSIRMAEEPRFKSAPISIEFVYHNNRYYACLLFAESLPSYPKTKKQIGLDVGISTFAVGIEPSGKVVKFDIKTGFSDETARRINAYTRLISLKFASANGKRPTSKRYERVLYRLRNAYHRHTNVKKNFIEQTAHAVAKEYDIIGIESLAMARMLRKRSVAKWYIHKPYAAFLTRLKNKATSVGKTVLEVPKNFPSSQLCHVCGGRSPITKDLSVRKWTCPHCQAELDRDENAAANILNRALTDARIPLPKGK